MQYSHAVRQQWRYDGASKKQLDKTKIFQYLKNNTFIPSNLTVKVSTGIIFLWKYFDLSLAEQDEDVRPQ